MIIHDFSKSLAKSHIYRDAPWWFDLYRAAFPSLESCACVRKDGWAQRGGIDWRMWGREWIEKYPEKVSDNGPYDTLNVAVPTGVLLAALGRAMRVEWPESAP